MTIRIHDSLTRETRPLEPLEPGVVRLYVCGPTVYDDSHIGHLMGPVIFDAVARWLRVRGYRVRFVNNITDIDDKIIRRANDTGEGWKAIADRYTDRYFELLRDLNVTTITDHPRCTEYVQQMVDFIADLIRRGKAYEAGDGVYFDVQRQDGYGKLSGRRVEDMQAGARIEGASDLHHPADFALWKKAKPGEPHWPSPWGEGRPGWHIECSVMSSILLGPAFEIHGGGDDLKFPHHENEIAQSEAHGDAFASLWMHNGLIQYDGKKIAKSDPRMRDPDFAVQFSARWLIDHYGAPAVRFFLLRSPYGRPVDFGQEALTGARRGLVRLHRQLGDLVDEPGEPDAAELLARPLPADLAAHRDRFAGAMDEDFNTGEAIAELFSIAKTARELEGADQRAALVLLRDLGRLLGMFCAGDGERLAGEDERLGGVVQALIALRAEARERRDFATADGLRDLMARCGVEVQDAAAGSSFQVDRADPELLGRLLDGALRLRREARERKDFATSDGVRDRLAEAGVRLLDGPDGTTWELE